MTKRADGNRVMTRNIGTNITLDKIITTVGELPTSPAVVSAIIGLTSNLDSKIIDISRVLKSDQSLTARVLRLSNSSFYGRSSKVKTLEEAILLLGFSAVCSMVVATLTHSMYRDEEKDSPEMKLWRHSLSTAIAARQIARHIKYPEIEEIFVAALLHDIGKLVLLQKLPERYLEIINEVEKNASSFTDSELQAFGFDHCDVASLLLNKWLFPASLTDAISRHHQLPAITEDRPVNMTDIIDLANHMAKRLGVGFQDHRTEDPSELQSARVMSLDKETLEDIHQEIHEFFQVEVGIIEETKTQ